MVIIIVGGVSEEFVDGFVVMVIFKFFIGFVFVFDGGFYIVDVVYYWICYLFVDKSIVIIVVGFGV